MNFNKFIEEVNIKDVFIIISWIIINFVYMTIFYKTIEIFNQFYLFISVLLSEYIIFFIEIKTYKGWQIACNIVLMLICSFMILVFVEIIELNFCGLSDMTNKNIELRARIDSLMNNTYDINDEDDDENTFIDLKDYTYDVSRISVGESLTPRSLMSSQ